MTRALLPGRWNRHGRAVPLTACTGSCNQGRAPYDCTAMPRQALRPVLHPDLHRITLTELDLELPHDATRVIKAPPPPLLTRARRERSIDIFKAVLALAFLAFGLWIWPR